MPQHPVILRLPGQADRQVALVEAEHPEQAARITAQKFPYLPLTHVWVGDRALAGLLAPRAAIPAGLRKGLRQGQTFHRDRLTRQRHAERWRQHWIDKADAKRKRA